MKPPSIDSRLLFAGIDGGGSTTRALIASPDGAVFGCGYAEGSNPAQLGLDLAQARLRAAINGAWKESGLDPQPLSGVFCAVAGLRAYAATAPIDSLWTAVFSNALPAQINWDHDLRAALAGGLSGQPGIVLVAGTGSACYGRNADGETIQVGGWGSLLDDAGSGYALGLALLRHAIRAWEERAPSSLAIERLSAEIGVRDPGEALRWIRSSTDPRPAIARLASLVLQSWRDGDPFATRWVDQGADELAKLVATATRRLFKGEKVDAVFSGGLSQDSGYFEKVREAVAKQADVHVRKPELNGTAGALLLALTSREIAPSEALLKKLRNLSAASNVDPH